MENSELAETKKIDSSYWKPIWFYVREIDHGSYLLAIACDETISDGQKILHLVFINMEKTIDRSPREICGKSYRRKRLGLIFIY